MKHKRYLTKSRFKTAYECPRKLFYLDRPEYGNKNKENEFLVALAQGGHQVGALAKIYYPKGIDLEGVGTEEAIAQTEELLKNEDVTIFEAALNHGPYLVRVDVLEKVGKAINLIEVKAKSIPDDDRFFTKKKDGILSKWEEYIVDIAFQTWVAQLKFNGLKIIPYLLLADKETRATVDGLHQCFKISEVNGRSRVTTKAGTNIESVGTRLLKTLEVADEVNHVITDHIFPYGMNLQSYVEHLTNDFLEGNKSETRLSSLCKNCEFKISHSMKKDGTKSGFDECWIEGKRLNEATINDPLIFDLWNFRKSEDLLAINKVFLTQITKDDLIPKKESAKAGLPSYERQWIQVQKVKDKDTAPYIDKEGLADLFRSVKYPLHLIDFETSMAAIPFHKGRRPYEQIAFQFSHHIITEAGEITHQDQYIHVEPGIFPNFDFVRALRDSLSKDEGTIFRFADHENTVLRQVKRQLEATPSEDADELIEFIRTITKSTEKEPVEEKGHRCMVDLRKIVLDNFYHPLTGGSNSIKKVIPAVLNESKFLQEKYSKPIYGKNTKIKSLNFEAMTWLQFDTHNNVIDPYKQLPPLHGEKQSLFDAESSEDSLERLFNNPQIKDGGAAMTAWARLQFTEMTDQERTEIKDALLRYCELDTLAMVWLLEYFKEIYKS